jgi:hypothetical protein
VSCENIASPRRLRYREICATDLSMSPAASHGSPSKDRVRLQASFQTSRAAERTSRRMGLPVESNSRSHHKGPLPERVFIDTPMALRSKCDPQNQSIRWCESVLTGYCATGA